MSDSNHEEAPAQILFVPPLRSQLEEARALSSNDYRRTAITILCVLNSASTSDTKQYTVPSTHKLLIHAVMPHIAIIGAAASETEPATAFATQHALNRLLMKAMNCRIVLTNTTDSTKVLGENKPMALSTLFAEFGDRMDWSQAPHFVGPGEVLELSTTLIQTGAPFIGIDTEYGVTLDAMLVRVKPS